MLASAETTEVPWEQQALNLVIQTVQEALHEKPPGEQQPLQPGPDGGDSAVGATQLGSAVQVSVAFPGAIDTPEQFWERLCAGHGGQRGRRGPA